MTIIVDIWGGDLHQNYVKRLEFDAWPDAASAIEAEVEAGLLCNVLHSDFKCPDDKVEVANVAMSALVRAGHGQ